MQWHIILLMWLLETNDMHAQSQNKLSASSIDFQDVSKDIEEPQDNGELVERLSQSSFVGEQDDGFVDPPPPVPAAECDEDMIPDYPSGETPSFSRMTKKEKKKSRRTTSVSPVMT